MTEQIAGEAHVYNMSGELVKTYTEIGLENEISTEGIIEGIYILRHNDSEFSLKFIIE